MNNTDFKATENPTFSRPKIDISKDFRRSNSQIWQKKQQRNKILCQCFSTFLLQRNPTQAWRSLTEPHALIRESSDVRNDEATFP